MKSRIVAGLEVAAALAALGLGLFAARQGDTATVRADRRQMDAARERIDELARRLADAERRPAELAAAAAPAPAATAEPPDLVRRIEALDASIRTLEEAARALREGQPPARPEGRTAAEAEERARMRAETVEALRATVCDPAAEPGRRIAALEVLRTLSTTTEVRDRDVVLAAAGMLDGAHPAEEKARLIRALKGVDDGVLAEKLLPALVSAPEASVREKAAETLGRMLERPSVRAGLERAAGGDADRAVREQARESLREEE